MNCDFVGVKNFGFRAILGWDSCNKKAIIGRMSLIFLIKREAINLVPTAIGSNASPDFVRIIRVAQASVACLLSLQWQGCTAPFTVDPFTSGHFDPDTGRATGKFTSFWSPL